MRYIFICLTLIIALPAAISQTLIGSSSYQFATANHNQRKIVRDAEDNMFIVYVDSAEQGRSILGVKYDSDSEQWGDPAAIAKGNNPTLSICREGRIHLVYESEDAISKITHMSSGDFTDWTPGIILSDTRYSCELPVADIDSTGDLNTFWIRQNENESASLIYACVREDTLYQRDSITTKNEIFDIAIANHLQYVSDELIYAMHISNDSLLFFYSDDKMESVDTLHETIGSQPCITFNSYYGEADDSPIRLLYLDENSYLYQAEGMEDGANSEYSHFFAEKLGNQTEYICIDDVLPPIGYSYLCMQADTLYHRFNFGPGWRWDIVLDTISTNPLFPSLAYKTYNSEYVDFIWMEKNGELNDIYYMRDAKFIYIYGSSDNVFANGISITGYPNPFREQLTIKVTTEDQHQVPKIEIYSTSSMLVNVLEPEDASGNTFSYTWNGTTNNDVDSPPGVYIIVCTVDNNRTARKVILSR